MEYFSALVYWPVSIFGESSADSGERWRCSDQCLRPDLIGSKEFGLN